MEYKLSQIGTILFQNRHLEYAHKPINRVTEQWFT